MTSTMTMDERREEPMAQHRGNDSKGNEMALLIGAFFTAILAVADACDSHEAIIITNAAINLAAKVISILFNVHLRAQKEWSVTAASGTITGAVLLDAAYALLDLGHPFTHWSVVIILTSIADEMMTTISKIFGQAIIEHKNPKRVRAYTKILQ